MENAGLPLKVDADRQHKALGVQGRAEQCRACHIFTPRTGQAIDQPKKKTQ